MNKKLKAIVAMGLVGVCSFGMVACGGSDNVNKDGGSEASSEKKGGKTLTIGMKASHVEISNIEHHKEKWEAETGNKIEIQAVDDNQFDQLMLTKMASGGMWDIFIGDTGTQADKYKSAENIVSLSDEDWVGNLNDIGKEFVTEDDGKVYCFPYGGVNSFGIVYNKKVFEENGLEVPKTFDEFDKVCEILKSKGVTPLYVSMKDGWTVNQILNGEWPNILAKNPDALDKLNKNEIRWDELPEFVNLFERINGWVENGYVNKDLATASYEMAQKAVASGNAAMMYMGDWADPEYIKTEPNGKGNLGMFAAPSENGKSYLAAAGPGGIYISNQSKNIDDAKAFLKYMATEEAIKYDLEKKGCTSVWKDIDNNKLSDTLKDSTVYFDSGMSQKHYNQTYVITPSAEAESAVLSVLLGQKSPDEAAKIWSDEVIKVGKQLGFDGFTN